jgi:branched-subunit amino acid ABC-type transport system permease component
LVNNLIEVLLSGLVVGCVYALVALGMSLIYSMSRVINIAQGAVVVLAALVGVSLQNRFGISGAVLLLPTAAIFAVGMAALDRLVVRPGVRRVTPQRLLLISVGVLQAIGGLLLIVWGNLPYTMGSFSQPAVLTVVGVRVTTQTFWVVGVLVACLIGLWLLLEHTEFGLRMRATAQDPDAVSLMGVNVDIVRTVAFAIAGAMAALAGVALLPVTFLQYGTVVPYAVSGFIAAVLGGLGSSLGAVLGGLVLGVIQGILERYTNSSVAEMLTMGGLILVLLIRPAGLLGRTAEVRR